MGKSNKNKGKKSRGEVAVEEIIEEEEVLEEELQEEQEDEFFNYLALKDTELRLMSCKERVNFVQRLKQSLKLTVPIETKLKKPELLTDDDLEVFRNYGNNHEYMDKLEGVLFEVYPNIKEKIFNYFHLESTLEDITDVEDIYDEVIYLLCLGYDVSSVDIEIDSTQQRFNSKYAEVRLKLNLLKGYILGYDFSLFADRLICSDIIYKVICEDLDAVELIHPAVQVWFNDSTLFSKIENTMVDGFRSAEGDNLVLNVLVDVMKHIPYSSLYEDKYFDKLTTPYQRLTEDERFSFCMSVFSIFKNENIFNFKGCISDTVLKACKTVSLGWRSHLSQTNYDYMSAMSNYFNIPLGSLDDNYGKSLLEFAMRKNLINNYSEYVNEKNCLNYLLLAYNDIDVSSLIKTLEIVVFGKSKGKFNLFRHKSDNKISIVEGREIISSIIEGLTYGFDITAIRLGNCGYRENVTLILDFCKYCWRFGTDLLLVEVDNQVVLPKDITN